MIKIRYRDPNELSPGLHAAAERHGRNTTVYLLSGLSAAQRRAVLRRLRISGRRGYDPRLPAPQLALALLADRIRTTFRRAGAVFREHPAGSTVPVMVISAGAIAFLALSAVSIRVIHHPRDQGPLSSAGAAGVPGAGPSGSVHAGSRPGESPGPAATGLADPGQPGSASYPGQPRSGYSPGYPGSAGSGNGSGTGNGGGTGNGNGNGSGNGNGTGTGNGGGSDPSGTASSNPGTGTTLGGGSTSTPTSAGDPTSATTAAPPSGEPTTPAPSATTSKPSSGSGSGSGLCVDVGPLGLCL
jgi:hypothetical protein